MKFLITAGPTREPIDPVRFLSNRSSGKMGYAIAEAAHADGHEVVLVSGPVCLAAPEGVRVIRVTTADEMFDAVHANLDGIDIAVLVAAVSDFKPATCAPHKIKKHEGTPQIALVRTRDILASLGAMKERKFFLAGFAAETEHVAAYAQKKLHEKRCDAIIANDVSAPGLGFDSAENEVTIFYPDSPSIVLPRSDKHDIARVLVNILQERRENR